MIPTGTRPCAAASGVAALALLALLAAPAPIRAQTGTAALPPARAAALEGITARSLKGHLFFLASDELQGRNTPSPGLDIAARYLATQFERVGLEPAGDDGFFQTSPWITTVTERERTSPSGERRIVRNERPVPFAGAGSVENAVGEPYPLRNVAGILRGSDPVRRDSWILVTAHYDHIGIRSGARPDSICNGANDNGSSAVALIELAQALVPLKAELGRSILFLAFFGEERGLLGSSWYTTHPLVPLERTVGVLNMEQIGRIDGDGGLHPDSASFTGFTFSTLPQFFRRAGERLGIEVYEHPRFSDPYFRGSDNIAFARVGVPAHTACTLYQYDEYHQPGDNPDRIDYENMARVVRMFALGLIEMAAGDEVPRWNEELESTAGYVSTWRALTGGAPPPLP